MLVVQNREPRDYTDDEVYALEVIAMVIAEMAELGAFVGPGAMELARPHRLPFYVKGFVGQEGVAEGTVVLHEPQIVVADPITDDPTRERARLRAAIEALRAEVDEMLAADYLTSTGEHRDVLNAYRMFAHDKGWVRRLEASVESGLAAEVAVEKEQSATRTRMTPLGRPLPPRAAARSRRPVEPPAAAARRQRPAGRPRAARGRDPRRPQHRAGRAARLRPQAPRRGARGGLGGQPRGDRRARPRDSPRHPGRSDHPRGDERRPDPRRRRPRPSCTCAPRRTSPRPSARRSTCCTRRRPPTRRCATSRRRRATG